MVDLKDIFVNSLNLSINFVRIGHISLQPRFFRVNLDCTIFSAHHLLRIFPHKRSVTVIELSDYITRRKKKYKNFNI